MLCLGSRIPVHESSIAAQKVQVGLAFYEITARLLKSGGFVILPQTISRRLY